MTQITIKDSHTKLSPKSQKTRRHILDVAMRLLAEFGYDRAGNAAIAQACDITRGALLYHFPTRQDLIQALAWHIHAAREAAFEHEAKNVSSDQDALDGAIDAYWRLLGSQPYAAFLALERVALCDKDIASMIGPAQEAFDRGAVGQVMTGLIQAGSDARFQTSRDLARFALDGLYHAALTYDGPLRAQNLIKVIKRAVHMLNRKGDIHDLWGE